MASAGLVPGDISLDEKRALCERDAPPAASEALEVVHCVFDMMKLDGGVKQGVELPDLLKFSETNTFEDEYFVFVARRPI